MRQILSAAAALMVLAGPVWAGFYDGNTLHRVCSEATGSSSSVGGRDADTNFGYCFGFILGVIDTLLLVEGDDDRTFCLPEEVKAGQAVDVVKKHLRDHPEDRHKTASLIAAMALNSAWPCR